MNKPKCKKCNDTKKFSEMECMDVNHGEPIYLSFTYPCDECDGLAKSLSKNIWKNK